MPQNSSKNKIHFSLLLVAILGTIIILFLPRWWRNGTVEEFKLWYPNIGIAFYYFYHYSIPILYFTLSIYLLSFYANFIYRKLFLPALNKLAALPKIAYTQASSDVFPKVKYTSALFFRLLSVIYLLEFLSLIYRIELVTQNGIIPYKELVEKTWAHEGLISLFHYPSIFWINQSGVFIFSVLLVAALSSLYSIFYKIRWEAFFIQWFVYLSITTFGRDLYNFPFDVIVLETGVLSVATIFYINKFNSLPRIFLIAHQLYFFRQWLSMALVKIFWADPTWYDFTFMKFFWLNQPSPTPLAWYAYHLPMEIQKFLTASTLVLELAIPIAMLFGRKGRIVAFFISLGLSIGIELNGNYGIFNIVTALIGVWCLDDIFFNRKSNTATIKTRYSFLKIPIIGFVLSMIGFNIFYSLILFSKQSDQPMNFLNYYFYDSSVAPKRGIVLPLIFKLGKVYSRFRIISPQGVYKRVAREKLFIKIEVKAKEQNWQTIGFKKGENIIHFHFYAPFMSRLAFKFNYWSVHTDFFMFLKMHTNSSYINSWTMNLVHGIFTRSENITKQIVLPPTGEIEQIRIYRMKMHIHEGHKQPFIISSPLNTIADSLYINPKDTLSSMTLLNLKPTKTIDELLWK